MEHGTETKHIQCHGGLFAIKIHEPFLFSTIFNDQWLECATATTSSEKFPLATNIGELQVPDNGKYCLSVTHTRPTNEYNNSEWTDFLICSRFLPIKAPSLGLN
ncbi:uncharacterized protein YALI1_A14458g [Yarrowia lipolytica]|uniref:Uncharacterized protein n=1 Tax=Yarrowia lipolytica TaxID=4952 RepID=A0A1D8N4S4_YARLL|nr:hypothetical protein YALI1_A14458g [Yarrowia lipolytica]